MNTQSVTERLLAGCVNDPSSDRVDRYATDALMTLAADNILEYEDAYKSAMKDPCGSNERHCACVPHLRKRIKSLEVFLDEQDAWIGVQSLSITRLKREAENRDD